MSKKISRLSPIRIIAAGFIIVIILGTLLLMCPVSSSGHKVTDFMTAFFTSTSATCVTGLTVTDTASYWSPFGKAIILLLIQIGGLGTMTIAASVLAFFRKQHSLLENELLMQSSGSLSLGAVRKIARRIFAGTAIFELAGAIILSTRFIPAFGVKDGIIKSIFHSVSAFCNAGFDIMGSYNGGSSLSGFDTDIVVNVTIMLLIIIGGLGFIVWSDLYDNKFKFKNLQFHTKIVLASTTLLIVGGAVLFYVFEYNNCFSEYSVPQKIMAAGFMSVTTRTAGFSTIDIGSLSNAGSFLTSCLMLVGGSPGSTAGGMKTTTLAVICICAYSTARKRSQPVAFKKSISDSDQKQALSIMTIYLSCLIIGTLFICAADSLDLSEVLLEVASAIGTVGLSAGITASLSTVSKLLIVLFMFIGRIGGLSVAIILAEKKNIAGTSRPEGKLLIG